MDQTTQIQIILSVAFLLFLGFLGIIIFLLARLITNQHSLKKAQTELQEHADTLEQVVKERTRELAIAVEQYKNLFLKSREAIIIFNHSSGEIYDVNEEATRLFKLSSEDLKSRTIQDISLAEPDADFQDTWCERVLQCEDGSLKVIECLIGSTDEHNSEILQAICRDITEKRELEAQLAQGQKLIGLGLLAAGVAHELNNPLSSIYNSGYFIQGELSSPPAKVTKHLNIINSQIERCRKIINDLLNFSEAPKMQLQLEHADVNNSVKRTLSLIEEEMRANHINIETNFQDLPNILIDTTRLTQVIFNMFMNSVQAMPNGGELKISTSEDKRTLQQKDEILTNIDCIVIKISDTGVGISKQNLTKLFTPFFTTKLKSGGHGLGLSVSYQIIKMFHGTILVESEVGKGTKFEIVLPARK
ncbi:PAS domain S-box protein [bacterium]|nr:PAS domain S-box protein [bacterium]MBU1880530.1 PAS domain S-box protein [bacterium]